MNLHAIVAIMSKDVSEEKFEGLVKLTWFKSSAHVLATQGDSPITTTRVGYSDVG